MVLFAYRSGGVGILIVFCDNHRRRSYMEIRGFGICATHNCRANTCISRQAMGWRCTHCSFCNAPTKRQSSPDDLLFWPYNGYSGFGVPGVGYKNQKIEAMVRGNCCDSSMRCIGYRRKRSVAL